MVKLGLDISTHIIGLTTYDTELNEYKHDIINLHQYPEMIDKFNAVNTYFLNFSSNPLHKNIDVANIEEYKLQFKMTSITTIVKLYAINVFTTYTINNLITKNINKISEVTARKKIWGSIPKTEDSKEYICNLALSMFPSLKSTIETHIIQNHPEMLVTRGNNKGNILSIYSTSWMDVVDSLTMAKY